MNRSIRLASVATALALVAGALGTSATAAVADVAPNGVIAYSAWDEELNYDIYTFDPATPDVPPLRLTTDGRYNANPDWSPDGTKIAYDGWADAGGPRIQVMDADPATADQVVLSDPCRTNPDCYGDFQPAWAPDGTRIAFVSSRPNADGSDNWSYELYVMDATGEAGGLPAATRLTTDELPEFGGGIHDSQVTWSPDGSRIAFVSQGRGENVDSCDLWAMDPFDRDGDGFGDNLQRLTFDESFNCSAFEDITPEWAPNSSLIAFTSVRTGYFDIWVVNADDPTDMRNVTRTPTTYEDQPSWSPDGTQIIFRSSQTGAYEFYSLPVPTPEGDAAERSHATVAAPTPTQLTFDGANKQQADWGREPTARPSTVTLTVVRLGKGAIRTPDATISCGKDCVSTYVRGAVVELTATPKAGYELKRWGGACKATQGTVCTVTASSAKKAGAKFGPIG